MFSLSLTLYNAHGDVVQLANRDGVVSKNYDYDAFGNERNAAPNDTNPFRYSGEYFDSSSGTYYLRARYYDPATSRMLSEDPVCGYMNDPLSLNRYTYCRNNPVMFIDPSGMETIALRSTIERLGGTVAWNSKTGVAIVYLDGRSVQVYAGDKNGSFAKNGIMYTDDAWLFAALASTFDLGKGWSGRIERHGSGDGYQKHVHVYNGKQEWAQNEDGSPHDQGRNSSGSPPSSALKSLKNQKGWDWNAKNQSWLDKIVVEPYWDGTSKITYPNGAVVIKSPWEISSAWYLRSPPTPSSKQLTEWYRGTLNKQSSTSTPSILVPMPIPAPLPQIPLPAPMPIPVLP